MRHEETSGYHHNKVMKQLVMVHVKKVEMEHLNAAEMECEKEHRKMKGKKM